MSFFIVNYDRVTGRVNVQSFDDEAEAMRELNKREAAKSIDSEVVMLIGESEEQLRLTHGRYFRNAMQLAEDGSREMDEARRLAEV